MKKAISAGGIIVRNNPNKQILLIKFTHIKGLSFPKGHVENGESLEQTATREVVEETGLTRLKVIRKAGLVTRPSIERDGTHVMKDIHLFLMTSENMNFHRESEEVYGWFDIDEAIGQMAIPEEAEFLKKIKDQI